MSIIDFEATFRELAERRKEIDTFLAHLKRMLDFQSNHWLKDVPQRMYNRKKEEAQKRELLLNKVNQLFQLIRFMIKHNQLLKRNRLFQVGEMFNLYSKIQLSRIDELNKMMDDKVIINRENKVRGELQWQQVFA